MTDFKNLFKIIFKRFGIWILLLSLLIAAMNGVQTKYRLANDSIQLKKAVNEMSKDTGIKINNDRKISKDYIKEADKIAEKYASKYNIKSDDELNQMPENEFMAYNERQEEAYNSRYWELESYYRTYESIKSTSQDDSLGVNDYIIGMTSGIAVLVGIISMIITSLEQSLPYYEFSLMLPWKKRDEVWMKAIIVFIIGLGIFLINLIMNMFMISASDLSPLLNIGSFGNTILKSLLLILGTSIISVATGMIAGNFVGHVGLMIIAGGSIELIKAILDTFFSIFNPELIMKLDQQFIDFKEKVPELLKPFLGLIHVDMNYESLAGFIIIAVLWSILAYLVNCKNSSENAGYLVISKPISNIAKVLGILTLASVLSVIGATTVVGESSILIRLLIYILALLISIKLFDILFKIRLKF